MKIEECGRNLHWAQPLPHARLHWLWAVIL